MPSFILASQSPRRIELFAAFGVAFTAEDPAISEDPDGSHIPHLPMMLAMQKAAAVADRHPRDVVVGADTMIEFEGRMIGKPLDLKEAREFLLAFSGRTHAVITGVCLMRKIDHLQCVFSEETLVAFKPFDSTLVDDYFTKVDPLDKAGAYAAQIAGDMLIERIDGSFTNVVGLPTERLAQTIRAIERAGLVS